MVFFVILIRSFIQLFLCALSLWVLKLCKAYICGAKYKLILPYNEIELVIMFFANEIHTFSLNNFP